MLDLITLFDNYKHHLAVRGARWPGPALGVAKKFIVWCEGSPALLTRDDGVQRLVSSYFDLIKTSKYTSQTRKKEAGILRTMLRCSNIPWPIPAGEGPRDEGDTYSPSLDPRAIKVMVEAALSSALLEDEAAFLALSTIYGLRRWELISLVPEHLVRDEEASGWFLHVPTAKGNIPRIHQVHEAIEPFILRWSFRESITAYRSWEMFRNIEFKAGLSHPDEVGWHSIRRTLDTLLLERLPEVTVESFMGWSSNLSKMPKRYHKTSFVGFEDGDRPYSPKWRREIDDVVFAQHPLVSYWKE